MSHENDHQKSAVPATERTEVSGRLISRRHVVGGSVAGFMGLALSQLGTKSAEAQPRTAIPIFPRATLVLLPASAAQAMIPQFMQHPDFQQLHDHFTSQGMQFIGDRARVGIHFGEAVGGATSHGPCTIMILPSFRSFGSSDPSHEAASVVAISFCDRVGGVLAGHVVVNHNPYQISQFSVLEVNPSNGTIVTSTATRAQVQSMSVQALADLLGPPLIPPGAQAAPSMRESDMLELARSAFQELLSDNYASPLYPKAGLRTLMNDTPLTQKWASVMRARYDSVMAGITVCTSTSSNACTSCSSTITIEI